MIVNRRTWMVKNGRVMEVAELLKVRKKLMKIVPISRVYTSDIGTFNQVALELEFANMTEYEVFWAQSEVVPDSEAFMEKWLEVTEGGINEIWQLSE